MYYLNFKEEDKKIITSEKNHNYTYYDFTEEKIKEIVSKNPVDLKNDDWRTLIQFLYPKNLIASGLFEPIVIFEIKDKKRVDPPIESYSSVMDTKHGNCLCLYERIYVELTNLGINNFHQNWLYILLDFKDKNEN